MDQMIWSDYLYDMDHIVLFVSLNPVRNHVIQIIRTARQTKISNKIRQNMKFLKSWWNVIQIQKNAAKLRLMRYLCLCMSSCSTWPDFITTTTFSR